jgi:hypothetical protein
MARASGAGPDDGHPALLLSYQSERGDILASLYFFLWDPSPLQNK